jgi:hypothetical protein
MVLPTCQNIACFGTFGCVYQLAVSIWLFLTAFYLSMFSAN